MKQLILLLAQTFFICICFSQLLPQSFIKIENLKKDVSVLSADSLEGRLTGSAGADKAAVYISNRFKEIGLKPLDINEGFSMPVNNSIGNIVGAIPGKSRSTEIVIFSAHYDHVGILNNSPDQFVVIPKKAGDSIFNGANDNASGIALLLSLAEQLVKADDNERTVIFIAFTGEEQGFIGSQHFADRITNPAAIKVAINFDMVGIPRYKKAGAFIYGYNTTDIVSKLNRNLRTSPVKFKLRQFFIQDPFPLENLKLRSDHVPFAKLGIYAVSISATSPDNKYYHTVNDEFQTLDFSFLTKLTMAVVYAVKPLLIDTVLK